MVPRNDPLEDNKPLSVSTLRVMWPYGKWTCADGREVLFNRGYCPILERNLKLDQPVKAAKLYEWINDIVHTEMYFDDGCPPWSNYYGRRVVDARSRVNEVLLEWVQCVLSGPSRNKRCVPAAAVPFAMYKHKRDEPLNLPPNPWKKLLEQRDADRHT